MKTKITTKDYLKVWFMALMVTALWAMFFASEYSNPLPEGAFRQWVAASPVTIVILTPFVVLLGWNIYLLWLARHVGRYTAKLEQELDAESPEPEIERKLTDYEQHPNRLPDQGKES